MLYTSTRDDTVKVSSAKAIVSGISPDGGLFTPDALPVITTERLRELCEMDYAGRAKNVLRDFLTDFTEDEIGECVDAAYSKDNFGETVAPISKLGESAYLLELWHGPTCAFKDMALQLLPRLLTTAAKKEADGKEILILVATSGDTGKAALAGFQDVPGTKVAVFYPENGVSAVQKLQMSTQDGENVFVCGVRGNFDDAQAGVKAIFTDSALKERLDSKNIMFSSANSINWGRLVPQIVYYVSAYCDLVSDGEITLGDKVNICVPTGNFGNILAAYYAKHMGIPFEKLICASNSNNVLTDFIRSGIYDRRRNLEMTMSPSMDILVSSNLERLLFSLVENNGSEIASLMKELSEDGIYKVRESTLEKLQAEFWGGYCCEGGTLDTVKDIFDTYSYLCDTHTAVSIDVYNQYVSATGDSRKTIIASTANPYKFSNSILNALGGECDGGDFENLKKLSQITGVAIPESILELEHKEARFNHICDKEGMASVVLDIIIK